MLFFLLQIMDSEFTRGTRILNYLTSILLCYFANLPPRIVDTPPGESLETLLALVGVQFKALMEMGIDIDQPRLAGFFHNNVGPDLRPRETVLNQGDTQRRIFIAMEGSYERPQELAIIVANGLRILDIQHVIGRVKNPNYKEKRDKKFVHGLTPTPRHYLSRRGMVELLTKIISRSAPTEIVYWDEKLTDIIPYRRDKMLKINKPNWCLRASHYSHQAAMLFKVRRLDNHLNIEVPGHSHANYQGLGRRAMNVGDFNKQNFGYSCALVNAYEMMHLHLANPITRLNF